MGWFSWLFEEEEDPPNIDIHGLPQACVDDCKPILNILPFGECYTGRQCETEMLLWDQWENSEPQSEKVNGGEVQ